MGIWSKVKETAAKAVKAIAAFVRPLVERAKTAFAKWADKNPAWARVACAMARAAHVAAAVATVVVAIVVAVFGGLTGFITVAAIAAIVYAVYQTDAWPAFVSVMFWAAIPVGLAVMAYIAAHSFAYALYLIVLGTMTYKGFTDETSEHVATIVSLVIGGNWLALLAYLAVNAWADSRSGSPSATMYEADDADEATAEAYKAWARGKAAAA